MVWYGMVWYYVIPIGFRTCWSFFKNLWSTIPGATVGFPMGCRGAFSSFFQCAMDDLNRLKCRTIYVDEFYEPGVSTCRKSSS